MRFPLALLVLAACDPTSPDKAEVNDSLPVVSEEPDADNDGYSEADGDCDDFDPSRHPGLEDHCDDIDQDCDGVTDEDAPLLIWYNDDDQDGFGDSSRSVTACSQPDGAVADDTDCNDKNPKVYAGATEVCNAIDDDCDGTVDGPGALGATLWFEDADQDGFGDPLVFVEACAPGVPGYVEDDTDCDEEDPEINPDASELCDNVDNNCDDLVDGPDALDVLDWWRDADGDGFGDPDVSLLACWLPSGYTDDFTDCDDAALDVYPGADETCNAIDDDCDGVSDEDDAIDATTWYADGDGDGYGDIRTSTIACNPPPMNVASPDDCDDTQSNVPSDWEYEEGMVLIGYPIGDVIPSSIDINGSTLTLLSEIAMIGLGAYEVPAEVSTCGAVAAVAKMAGVRYAEPNFEMQFKKTPDDPSLSYQFLSKYTMYSALSQWNLRLIGAEAAWDCSEGAGMVVAVIDSGVVNLTADGLNNAEPSVECYDWGCAGTSSLPTSTHGSHVAGTIAQATNNGLGVAGLSNQATILSVRVCGLTTCDSSSMLAMVEAFNYVYAGGLPIADLINLSMGPKLDPIDTDGDGIDDGPRYTPLSDAVSQVATAGVFVALVAGNTGQGVITYPMYKSSSISESDGVMTVGSVGTSADGTVARSEFSSYGIGLDIMAPGSSIQQDCFMSATFAPADFENRDCILSGTSMASPHVAAAAALLMAVGATAGEAEAALRQTAGTSTADLLAGGFGLPSYSKSEYGSGVVLPGAALNEWLNVEHCVEVNANVETGSGAPVCEEGKSYQFIEEFYGPATWIDGFPSEISDANFFSEDSLFLSDVNGDDRADAVFYNWSTGTLKVAMSGGCDSTLDIFTYLADCDGDGAHDDRDGDGSPDSLWEPELALDSVCGSSGLHQVLMGDVVSHLGTFDADDASDIVVYCENGDWYALPSTGLGKMVGSFDTAILLATGLGPTSACVDDNYEPVGILANVMAGDPTLYPISFCDGTWEVAFDNASSPVVIQSGGVDLVGYGDEDGTDSSWVQAMVYDVNADDQPDFVNVAADEDWIVWINGNSTGTHWVEGIGGWADHLMIGDVNDDGCGDVVVVYSDDGESRMHDVRGTDCSATDCDGIADGIWKVALGEIDGSSSECLFFPRLEDGDAIEWVDDFGQHGAGGERFFIADVNGDGYDDAVGFYPTANHSDPSLAGDGIWRVALSGVFACE